MFYGSITLYSAALVLGVPISIDWQAEYLLSLFYLAFFATVLAFWAYISLMGRIGADRAAYTTLIFPVVALLISSVVEDYCWSIWSVGGLLLVLGGNWPNVTHSARSRFNPYLIPAPESITLAPHA
jgi:drug/metabolite transporter (DMT)-like permease